MRLSRARAAAAVAVACGLAAGAAFGGAAAPEDAASIPLLPFERAPTVFAPVWDGLVGRWLARSEAGNAQGTRPVTGATSFAWELDGRVLTRRQVLDYPPSNGHAGLHHEDLMTLYPAPDGRHAEAMYYDNDGHVVHYAATWASDDRTLVLVSFPEDGAPRLRLTWTLSGADRLAQDFELARPGTTDFDAAPSLALVRAGR